MFSINNLKRLFNAHINLNSACIMFPTSAAQLIYVWFMAGGKALNKGLDTKGTTVMGPKIWAGLHRLVNFVFSVLFRTGIFGYKKFTSVEPLYL